ncbi:MAG: putative transcriptional regulator of 2-aminoethylphosphonate degradation operons [Lentisphaerae bacterium ADurb.Bin242]|nr:MAG: putative transcriptional regulator of 2-aminoethylphosphonate degradation operons [Lentisphaerae bacterium ADurb.Bin242]
MKIELKARNKEIPVYDELRKMFVDAIRKGKLKTGDRITPEEELAKMFKTSRTTVRKAMACLQEENLILRFPRKGTFINSNFSADESKPLPIIGVDYLGGIIRSGPGYYGAMIEGIVSCARRNRMIVTFLDKDKKDDPEKFAGIIFLQEPNKSLPIVQAALQGVLPGVGINRKIGGHVGCLCVDYKRESYLGVKKLIERGYRDIGYYGNGFYGDEFNQTRYAGYYQAMTEAGLPLKKKNIHFFSSETNRYLQAKLYFQHARISALFVSLAPILFSVLYAMNILRISPAEDIKVLCFDNLEDMELNGPDIAYIKMPLQKMGVRATEYISQKLTLKNKLSPVNEVYPAEFCFPD